MALCLVAMALVLAVPAGAEGEAAALPFRVGFSRQLFSNVNDADAKASIKLWAQTVARERKIDMDPSAQLFERTHTMIEAMRQGTVDAMSLRFDEYLALSREIETGPWFVTQTMGEHFEEYVLLVREDTEHTSLDALGGRRLLFHDSPRTCLAMDWLQRLLMEQGHRDEANTFFGAVQRVNKVSSAVLPVFFGKADVAMVAKSNYLMACELNPQIGRKLRTIAVSPPLVPAIMCFRKNFESPDRERILSALSELHTSTAGEQVLLIFQSEALVQVDEQPLIDTTEFLREAREVRTKLALAENPAIHSIDAEGGLTHE